jgi:uncharacterized protein (DUF58 family)
MQKLDLSKIREYGNLDFLSKQLVEGFITGLHKSPFHGFSVEFAEHRLYNSGESTRYIDWKVFAKTDKLFVKRFEEETNLRCHLLVDVSSSMYYPIKNNGKLTFSTLAAGTLANMLQRQRDAVSLVTFSDEIETHTECKSTTTHIMKVYHELEKVLNRKQTLQKTSVVETLHEIADKIHTRSLVVIFSDMFENMDDMEKIFSAMQHLKHKKHEVLLFHVTDKKTELDFDFDERPYEFIDLESGEKVKIQPSQVKEKYIAVLEDFQHELKIKCGQYKIDYIEVDIEKGFDQILSSFLAKRAKMR